MSRIKMYDGTRSGVSLCVSCSRSHIFKGPGISQESVLCYAHYDVPRTIKFPIIECNRYHDTRQPDIHEYTKIAWVVNSDKRTGKVGFTHVSKMSQEDRDKIVDEA